MRVLIGCECSGVVRKAFRDLGHDAWSCDLKPAEDGSPFHLQMDIWDGFKSCFGFWDMVGLHPDCTAVTNSGNRWYGKNMPLNHLRGPSKDWIFNLWDGVKRMGVKKVYLENPVGVLNGFLPEKPQIIQPWMFGHGETKATCLWLHGLPNLVPTDVVEGREHRIWNMAPGPNRKTDRSRTLSGVGRAMAEQWGKS